MKLHSIINGLNTAEKILKKEYLPRRIKRKIDHYENYHDVKNRVVYRLSGREMEAFLSIMSKLVKERFSFDLPSKSYVQNSKDYVSYEKADIHYCILSPNINELYTLVDYEDAFYIYYRGIHIYVRLKSYRDSELYFVNCYGPDVKEVMPRIMKYVEKTEDIKCKVGITIRVMLSDGKRVTNTVSYIPLERLILKDDVQHKLYDITKRYLHAFYTRKLDSFGIVLYGPSGSGKTTIVKSIAHECNLPIITVPSEVLLSKDFSLSTISSMRTHVILIEEIDRIFVDRDDDSIDSKFRYQCEAAIATLMQLLDGVLTPRNSIFVLTTNYPELLNRPELTRESRIDETLQVNYFSEEMAIQFLASQNIPEEDIHTLLERSKLSEAEKELYRVENETEYVYPQSKISLNVTKYKRS